MLTNVHLLRFIVHLYEFLSCLQRETTFMTSCFPRQRSHFRIGSTLKGKNLLLEEQMLMCKSLPLMRWESAMKVL